MPPRRGSRASKGLAGDENGREGELFMIVVAGERIAAYGKSENIAICEPTQRLVMGWATDLPTARPGSTRR